MREDEFSVSFYHPRPLEKDHILVVPKTPIPGLLRLARPDLRQEMVKLLGAIRDTADEAESQSGRIVFVFCNGGPRQDVPQVHWHLTLGHQLFDEFWPEGQWARLDRDIEMLVHQSATWSVHLVLRSLALPRNFCDLDEPGLQRLTSMLGQLPQLDRKYGLSQLGFAVCLRSKDSCGATLTMHVVAGERSQDQRTLRRRSGPNQ